MTEHHPAPRSPSPWSGSRYETQHRWQLDGARNLPDAADNLHALATELTAAHEAGWALVEPVHNGHLLATRASRRKRAQRREPTPCWPPRPPTSDWHGRPTP